MFNDDEALAPEKLVATFLSATDVVFEQGYRPSKAPCTLKDIYEDYTCLPLVSIFYTSSGKTQTIKRVYVKFLSTAGEIGGLIDLFFILGGFFYSFYNGHKQK